MDSGAEGVEVPWWLGLPIMAMVIGIPLYGALRRRSARREKWRRLARRLHGQCYRCGYDLRGNVSGFCPECGAQAGEASGSG